MPRKAIVLIETWTQQDGYEFANNRILADLGVISGLVYVSFSKPSALKKNCLILFPGHFLSISDSYFCRSGPPHRRSRMECIAKKCFLMEIVFSGFRDQFLEFLGCLGSRFSDSLGLAHKLENETISSEKRMLITGFGGADRGVF